MKDTEKHILSILEAEAIVCTKELTQLNLEQKQMQQKLYSAVHEFLLKLSKTLVSNQGCPVSFIYKNFIFYFGINNNNDYFYVLKKQKIRYMTEGEFVLNQQMASQGTKLELLNIEMFLFLFKDYEQFLNFVEKETILKMKNSVTFAKKKNETLSQMKNEILN